MEQCSLIAAPYASDWRVLAVLGVIGPTRLDYDRVITPVQATAQALPRTMADRVGRDRGVFQALPPGLGHRPACRQVPGEPFAGDSPQPVSVPPLASPGRGVLRCST